MDVSGVGVSGLPAGVRGRGLVLCALGVAAVTVVVVVARGILGV